MTASVKTGIVGAGSIACGTAALLSQNGHDPMLWSPSGEGMAKLYPGAPLTATGAIAGVVAMVVSWGWLFRHSGYGANRSYTVDVTIGGNVYETLPVVTIFLCSLIAMVAVSLVTKPPKDETLAKFF